MSASFAKDCAMILARAMMDGFMNATSSFNQEQELSDHFGEVLKKMTEAMMLTIASREKFDEFCNNKFADNDSRNIFLVEDKIFLQKTAWMVLQHIRSFPLMQPSDEYVKQHIQKPPSQSSRCNEKQNVVDKCELQAQSTG